MGLLCTASSDLTGLCSIFGDPLEQVPQARFVAADEIPEPYRRLLAHDQHMTVTMEDFHEAPVNVIVLKHAREGQRYARKILLTHSISEKVVQFGVMRFDFDCVSDEVRDHIIEGRTPLGRILIEHDVLRRISTHALMRMTPNAEMRRHFDLAEPGEINGRQAPAVYGRLATIFCNEKPAVDLLEVVAPVRAED